MNRVDINLLLELLAQMRSYQAHANDVFQRNVMEIELLKSKKNQSKAIDTVIELCDEILIPHQQEFHDAIESFCDDVTAMIEYYKYEVDNINLSDELLDNNIVELSKIQSYIKQVDDEISYYPVRDDFYNQLSNKISEFLEEVKQTSLIFVEKQKKLEIFTHENHFKKTSYMINKLDIRNANFASNTIKFVGSILQTVSDENLTNKVPNINNYINYSQYLLDICDYAVRNGFAIRTEINGYVNFEFREKYQVVYYDKVIEMALNVIILPSGKPVLYFISDNLLTVPNGIVGLEPLNDGDNDSTTEGILSLDKIFTNSECSKKYKFVTLNSTSKAYKNLDKKTKDMIGEIVQNLSTDETAYNLATGIVSVEMSKDQNYIETNKIEQPYTQKQINTYAYKYSALTSDSQFVKDHPDTAYIASMASEILFHADLSVVDSGSDKMMASAYNIIKDIKSDGGYNPSSYNDAMRNGDLAIYDINDVEKESGYTINNPITESYLRRMLDYINK